MLQFPGYIMRTKWQQWARSPIHSLGLSGRPRMKPRTLVHAAIRQCGGSSASGVVHVVSLCTTCNTAATVKNYIIFVIHACFSI